MCDTIVIVRPDRVLLAKNSDRDPNEAQVPEWHPRRTHAAGATVRCTWREVPQVAHTHAILISRPFWMWGAEMGANEHGVAIGNEAVFTKEPYAPTGLTGMDLVRLALERSATADEAVGIITELLERHGQGGGCGYERRSFTYHNSFAIADPAEAYVLETAGRHFAVERVSSGARSISNGLTIPGFAETHSDTLRTAVSACRTRRELTEHGAASGPATPAALMALLRSHGDTAAPRYSLANGGMAAPCMHAGGVLASSQTTASWVSELRRGSGRGSGRGPAGRHWVTATAAPCTSVFKPVSVTEPVDLGPAPVDTWDPNALWWRHERLHRRAMRDPETAYPLFVAERDELERRWLETPPGGSAAFAEADAYLARWTERVAAHVSTDARPVWVRRYWRARDARAGLPGGPVSPSVMPELTVPG